MLPSLTIENENANETVFLFGGEWVLQTPLKNKESYLENLSKSKNIVLNAENISLWDSSFIAFALDIMLRCKAAGISCRLINFPNGAEKLLTLATTIPETKTHQSEEQPDSIAYAVGLKTLNCYASIKRSFSFIRECSLAFSRLINNKAVMQKQDFLTSLQEAGVSALPIVSLISFMVGLILAFVGAIQLKMFGAQIFVAALVAIAMSRVMGAIMTGILMAGRTGASYAAVLGAMQANEEIDAFETLGVSPYDFLVLPRLLAMFLMMPLLTVYADLMSILGGAFVGVFMLDLTPVEYFNMTLKSLSVKNIVIGLIHSTVFGVIVALSGCYFGMKSGRNASAVGNATTASVVYSIVWIIVATAVITYICSVMGV